MAPKRKKLGDGEVKSQDESENPDEGASAEFSRSIYLVAEQEGEQSAYSVFKINTTAGSRKKRRRAHTVAVLPGTAHGMSFVAVHLKHGSWLVGVGGGLRAGTVIFDPSTSKTYRGPRFLNPKCDPVVISHGGEVYALSRRPRVVPPYVDFQPWFQSLSFNEGLPYSSGCGCPAYWRQLPPPPFFPSKMNPFQFRNPPEISVTSYAALDFHILLSTQQESIVGTYAFHVVNKTWEKVHAKNLPFVGQATPLGGSLFVACSISSNASASLFHMSIKVSSSTRKLASSLSIQEFPLTASEGKIPKPLFCPLGNASFCAIMLGSSRRRRSKHNSLEEDQLILTSFQIEDIDTISTACQSMGRDAKSLQVSAQMREQGHIYKSKGRSRVLDSDMPVVAALSMEQAVHRKRKTHGRHGRSASSTSDKPEASVKDLELEEREDRNQNEARDQEIVKDDSDEGLADADQPIDEVEGLNPAMIGHGDSNDNESQDRSIYLVARHWDWDTSSRPYSVYKMVDAARSDASSTLVASRKRLKRLAGLKTDASKVFTTVCSRHRAWVVGVGGTHGDTIIFDINNNKKVIRGPNLNSAKCCPVLTVVGDKVYAMSKTPSWVSEPDFPPWFEVLDLSKAKVITVAGRLHLEGCSWTPLPNPACWPWELSPTGYTRLPIVIVMAYVVVGPYILVSFNKLWGTYAFDTNAQEPYQWHKVNENSLPFIGCATPLGRLGSIFLGLSQKGGPINAYHICVATSDEDNAHKLSITVLPVKYMDNEVNVGPCFASVDSESFCSLSLSVDNHSLILKAGSDEWFPTKVHVNLTTYQLENPSVLENLDETVLAMKPEIVVSSQQTHASYIASSHGFSPFVFSLLSI